MASITPPAGNSFLLLLAQVAKTLEPRLAEVLKKNEAVARNQGEEVAAMVSEVSSLCARGGKRLRPGLCVVGALCANEKSDWSIALEAGVSLELLQAYFLIHDDWMDQDDERRGGPTAHRSLAKTFSSEEVGAASAILAGDHALALATAHLATLKAAPERLIASFSHFAEMQLAAVAGQQLDIVGKVSNPERTYELKTASYTVRGPLLLGAELAGGTEAVKKVLTAYALPAGIAFQLRDDLIGVFGPSKTTGKPQGGDLKEGKNTLLVSEARKLLTNEQTTLLEGLLGQRSATEKQVQEVANLLDSCGAKDVIESRIDELKREALGALDGALLSAHAQSLLQGALMALTERTY